MSFTGVYTEFVSDGSRDNPHPKIFNLDNFYDEMKEYSDIEIHSSMMITSEYKEITQKKYPTIYKKWVTLEGFRCYGDDGYNLDRIAIMYDKERFIEFFEKLSKLCEPFHFYHSPMENRFPSVVEMMKGGEKNVEMMKGEEEPNTIFKVKCNDGDVDIQEYKIKFDEV